jgi:hypothetical protein
VAITLKILHDADGRILAAVSDASGVAEGPQLAIRPAAGQRLAHVEVPVTHSSLSMGQLFKCLRFHEGQVIVGDPPVAKEG